MGALEDKLKRKRIISTLFFLALFLTRFLLFYEREGMRIENGFFSIANHLLLVGSFVTFFLFGTWKKGLNCAIRFALQSIPVAAMVLYEFIYLFRNDYGFRHARVGFWLYIFLSGLTIVYCLFSRE